MGVTEGGEREFSISKATLLNLKGRKRATKAGRDEARRAEVVGVTILLPIAPTVSDVQNMTLPSLSHDRSAGDRINTILCSDEMNRQTVITVFHPPQQNSTVQPDTKLRVL